MGKHDVDFAMAFDKVPYRRLLHRLEYYGIREFTHKWINSWVSVRTQQVVLDGQTSDPVPVLSVVLHGSVSPRSFPVPHLHKRSAG